MKQFVLASMLTLSGALAQTATPPASAPQGMPMPGANQGDMNAMTQQCVQMMRGMNGTQSAGMMSMMGAQRGETQGLNRAAIEAVARAYLKGQQPGAAIQRAAIQLVSVQPSGDQYQVRYRQGDKSGVLRINAATLEVMISP